MWGFLSRHTDALQCDSGKDPDAEGELATHLFMYKRGNSHAFLGSGAAAAKPAAPRLNHLDVGPILHRRGRRVELPIHWYHR